MPIGGWLLGTARTINQFRPVLIDQSRLTVNLAIIDGEVEEFGGFLNRVFRRRNQKHGGDENPSRRFAPASSSSSRVERQEPGYVRAFC